MKTLAKAFAAIGLAGAAISPSLAGEPDRMTVTIGVADLNLATPEGQRTLDRRIEKAARSVCRVPKVMTGTRIMNQDARACLAEAKAAARQQVAALAADQQRGG